MILKEESKRPFQANHKGQPTKEQNLRKKKKVSPIAVLFQKCCQLYLICEHVSTYSKFFHFI